MISNEINVIQEGTLFKIPLEKSNENIIKSEKKEKKVKKNNLNEKVNQNSFKENSPFSKIKNEKIKNDLEIDFVFNKIINEQEKLKFFVNNNSEIIEALTNYQVLKEKNNLIRKIKNFLKKLKISKELISYIINAIQKYEINKNSININEVNEFIHNQINEKRKTRKILRNIFDKVIIYSKQIGFID